MRDDEKEDVEETYMNGCETACLSTDIYKCLSLHLGCDHAIPFGYEILCIHPDRASFVAEGCRQQNHDR